MNILFVFFKIVSWMWAIFCILSSLIFLVTGQFTMVLFPLLFSIPALLVLIWRYKADKELREYKNKIKYKDSLDKQHVKYTKQKIDEAYKNIKQDEKNQKQKQKQDKFLEIEKINNEPEIIDNKKIYRFGEQISVSCTVTVEDNWITIERKKNLTNSMMHGLDGVKKIFIKNISGIQFKEPGGITAGYIQLLIMGSQENKGGILAATQDENTIMVYEKNTNLARTLVDEIERKIDELHSNKQHIISKPTQTIAQQIKEFKELLDEGIITQEEFDAKKMELLKK